jgi:serine/threonine protein kinase
MEVRGQVPASPKIGDEFAGHKLDSVIGRGGMGVVYLAENIRLKRKIALKLLPPELVEDKDFRERFSRESQMAATIEHPNIVPIYEAGEVEGLLYISMRYIPGSDLKTLIEKEGPLSLERTVHLLDQVASALDDAHERDLVHRDVKPQNILVQKRAGRRGGEQAYLTDFGLTKQRGSKTMTQAGSIVGTIDYMSPEALGAKEVDARADIYSLGCVFYECLTGTVPYEKDSDVAAITAHLYEDPPRLSDKRPDLPHDLDYMMGSALAKNADDRYATAGEMIDVARQVMESQATYSEAAYGGGAEAVAAYAGEWGDEKWAQGQWVDQGFDPSQQSDPSQQVAWDQQQSSDPSQQWGQQQAEPTQQGWAQQTSDPTQQDWGTQPTSDPGRQAWGQQQSSDPSQTYKPQQWSDPTQQGWGTQTSGERRKVPPLPVLIGGGVGLLALIVVLILVLGGGGGDEPNNNDNSGGVDSAFPPRSTTTFSGDAASLLPQTVAGLNRQSSDTNQVECAEGDTSKAHAVYSGTTVSGDPIIPAAQQAENTAELFVCLYDNPDSAKTDLGDSINNLTGDGMQVQQENQPLVDGQGNQVGAVTTLTNPDPAAGEFHEIFVWTNGNLSGAVGALDSETSDAVFNELQF